MPPDALGGPLNVPSKHSILATPLANEPSFSLNAYNINCLLDSVWIEKVHPQRRATMFILHES